MNPFYLPYVAVLTTTFAQDDCAAATAAQAAYVEPVEEVEDDEEVVETDEDSDEDELDSDIEEELDELFEDSDDEVGGTVEAEDSDTTAASGLFKRTEELCAKKKGCYTAADGDQEATCITTIARCDYCANWGACVSKGNSDICDRVHSDDDDKKTGLIVGLIVLFLALIAISVVVFCFCCGKNRRFCNKNEELTTIKADPAAKATTPADKD